MKYMFFIYAFLIALSLMAPEAQAMLNIRQYFKKEMASVIVPLYEEIVATFRETVTNNPGSSLRELCDDGLHDAEYVAMVILYYMHNEVGPEQDFMHSQLLWTIAQRLKLHGSKIDLSKLDSSSINIILPHLIPLLPFLREGQAVIEHIDLSDNKKLIWFAGVDPSTFPHLVSINFHNTGLPTTRTF